MRNEPNLTRPTAKKCETNPIPAWRSYETNPIPPSRASIPRNEPNSRTPGVPPHTKIRNEPNLAPLASPIMQNEPNLPPGRTQLRETNPISAYPASRRPLFMRNKPNLPAARILPASHPRLLRKTNPISRLPGLPSPLLCETNPIIAPPPPAAPETGMKDKKMNLCSTYTIHSCVFLSRLLRYFLWLDAR